MSPRLAAAVGNAQQRARVGWPLMVLTIAFYAPAGTGLARLVLIAAGLLFLTRQPAGPAITRPRPAKTTTQAAKAPAKASRQRGTNGRFQ